jgi:ribosomal protein L20A (L18A)
MTTGTTGSRQNVWYSVQARTRNRRKHNLAKNIRDKRDAEAIAALLRDLAGTPLV